MQLQDDITEVQGPNSVSSYLTQSKFSAVLVHYFFYVLLNSAKYAYFLEFFL